MRIDRTKVPRITGQSTEGTLLLDVAEHELGKLLPPLLPSAEDSYIMNALYRCQERAAFALGPPPV